MKQIDPSWKTLVKIEQILSNTSTDAPAQAVEEILRALGQLVKADRIYLDLLDEGKTRLQTVQQWCGAGLETIPTPIIRLDTSAPSTDSHLDTTNKRLVQTSPLIKDAELLGFLSVEAYNPALDWPIDNVRLVDQVATLAARLLPLDQFPLKRSLKAPGQAAEPEQRDRPHILIVEDDDANLFLLEKFIQRFGGISHPARSGLEAINACKTQHFDVILMDLNMPNLDGFDATRAIVAGEGINKDTPIVAVTADTTDGIERRCKKVGMKYYISKPLRHETIVNVLNKLIGRSAE